MNPDLKQLEQQIGYEFKDKKILINALTHSSYIYEHSQIKTMCNERLEFLGDAVLEVITSEYLYCNYPQMSEGDMSKLRSSLVCEESLANDCSQFELGKYLFMGKGEEHCGGRKRASVTSDACEALLGAIYLDGGFTNAKEFVHKFILDNIEKKAIFYDSKTTLQELCQERYKKNPEYRIISETGPQHDKVFEAEVKVSDDIVGIGFGKSKKNAEQHAAYDALMKLKDKSR